jgi:HPt (histidine-containing phosphotransfer) domain-containing protein/HAMP domain-containing protein
MKKSLWKRTLFFVIIPFIVIYIALSAFILQQVYQTQITKTGQELHKLALYNSVNLKNCYEVLELSVQIAAAELEKIDPESSKAREMGESILTTRFRNSQVINSWLVFESNAFDGMDALHTEDYPGAPSGQYIRSFNRNGESWETAFDIDETELEDAYWYRIARDTGAFFTDLGGYRLLWDYGNEDGAVSSIGVTSPIFRDTKVIGCVGLDAALNEYTLGEQILPEAVSAILLSDGRLGYSIRTESVGKDIEALGFSGTRRIREALRREEPLYLYNEYSGISRVKSFSYFHPVRIGGKLLYIYTSLPQRYVWLNTVLDIRPIGVSLFVSLVVFTVLLFCLSRTISAPLQKLIAACEGLAQGNLDIRIDLSHSGDELGMITRSLSRMAEQFRTSKMLQRRYQERIDIIQKIHLALFSGGSLFEAFNDGLTAAAEYFGIFKAALIFNAGERSRIMAVYPSQKFDEENREFFSHNLVVNLLENKKHLTMNYGALNIMQLPFIDYKTRALCILSLRTKDTLRGYIIMEGKEPDAFIHDDTTLIFLGETLSNILSCRTAWEQEAALSIPEDVETGSAPAEQPDREPGIIPPENAASFLEKAKTVQYLNIDRGLLLIGGEKEKYTELLRVTIRVITEGILSMRNLYHQDLSGFAILVHGMKGALYSIGAEVLGDEARKLEFAAKSDDRTYCTEHYPLFEEKLRVLSRNLAALFPRQERCSRTGSIGELKELLKKAMDACSSFDAAAANEILIPLSELKWDDEKIAQTLKEIGNDLENIEYDGAADKISRLLETLEQSEQSEEPGNKDT